MSHASTAAESGCSPRCVSWERAHAPSTTLHSASEGETGNQLKTTHTPKQRHTHPTVGAQGQRRHREKTSQRKRKGHSSWPRRSRTFLGKEETWGRESGGGSDSFRERERELKLEGGGMGEVVSGGSRLTDKSKAGKRGWSRISKELCRPC